MDSAKIFLDISVFLCIIRHYSYFSCIFRLMRQERIYDRVPPVSLDEVDRRIIRLLQERGRRTNADIARIIGMSESGVKYRIDNLIEKKVLQVLAVLNPEAVGFGAKCIVGIRTTRGEAERVAEALERMNEVIYVGFVTGRFDIMIDVVLKDTNELYHFLSSRLGEIPGIDSTETFYVMRVTKINYEWKLPPLPLEEETQLKSA